jgi:hypothetical protein
MQRTILHVLILVFLASLLGCQKKMKVAKTPPVPTAQTWSQSDVNKIAPVIIDICDPTRRRLRRQVNEPDEMLFICAVYLDFLAQKNEKLLNEELARLVAKYKETEENR